MSPLVKNGAKVLVDFNKPFPYYIGEVVVFFQGKKLVVHRILNARQTAGQKLYLLKGDNNRKTDGWIKGKQIIGRVSKIVYPSYQISLTGRRAIILQYIFVLYSYLTKHVNLREGKLQFFFKLIYRVIFLLHSKTPVKN